MASPGDAGKLLLIGSNSAAYGVACESEGCACNFLREAPMAINERSDRLFREMRKLTAELDAIGHERDEAQIDAMLAYPVAADLEITLGLGKKAARDIEGGRRA
jgi:hypothetical protein